MVNRKVYAYVKDGNKMYEIIKDPAELMKFPGVFEEYDINQATEYVSWWQAVREATIGSVAEHMERVLTADMSYPIILLPNGAVLDGYHRIVKALLDRAETIEAYRLNSLPPGRAIPIDEVRQKAPVLAKMIEHNEEVLKANVESAGFHRD